MDRLEISKWMNWVITERNLIRDKVSERNDWKMLTDQDLDNLMTPEEKYRWDILDKELNQANIESLKAQGVFSVAR